MRGSRFVALSLAAALIAPACGGRNCADVADDLVAELQTVLDEAAKMTPAELAEAQSGGEAPPFLQEVMERGGELEAEADELGCADDRMRELVSERIETLEAEPGTLAELLLQFLQQEDFFDGDGTP